VAKASMPHIAILGADHSDEEKETAKGLLREINPEVQVISF
jgi:hypothetical protein